MATAKKTRSVKSYIRAAKRNRGHRAACELAPHFMSDRALMRDPWVKWVEQGCRASTSRL
jgi:hypothetical protein